MMSRRAFAQAASDTERLLSPLKDINWKMFFPGFRRPGPIGSAEGFFACIVNLSQFGGATRDAAAAGAVSELLPHELGGVARRSPGQRDAGAAVAVVVHHLEMDHFRLKLVSERLSMDLGDGSCNLRRFTKQCCVFSVVVGDCDAWWLFHNVSRFKTKNQIHIDTIEKGTFACHQVDS